MEKQNKNTDKLTDKAFSRLLATSVIGIILCIIALCGSSWAWFSDSVPSTNNLIKAAGECLLTVTVSDGETEEIINFDDPRDLSLEPGKTYTVTLSLPADSASGYCIIAVGETKFYTNYIERHNIETPKTLTFTLSVETACTVSFTPRWGIYSGEYNVTDGGHLTIN